METPEELVGQKVSSWGHTISESEFTLLTDLTWLVGALHTDAEYMKKTAFGERILAGPLVLSLAVGLSLSTGVRHLMLQSPWKLVALLGCENVRFTGGGLKIGDTLSVETTFSEWRSTSNEKRKILVLDQIGFNQKGDKILEEKLLVLFQK